MANQKLLELNERTAAPLDVHVSPSVNPDVIMPLGETLVDDLSGPGEQAYGAARSALNTIQRASTDIDRAHTAMLQPEAFGLNRTQVRMAIPKHRESEVATAMANAAAKTAATVQRQHDVIEGAIGELSRRVATAISNPRKDQPSVVQASSEIRQYVANLADGKRLSFLEKAIEAGDHEVISSVLQASPFVSGLTREQYALVKSMAQHAFAPREARQLDAAVKARAAVQLAGAAFVWHVAKKIPRPKDDPREVALQKLKA